MKIDSQRLFAIQNLIPQHAGIFTVADLNNLFLSSNPVELQQKIKPFLQAKILYRFCRGFYVAPNFSLEHLSARICPHSAISFGNVLAKHLLIGSIPQKTVYAVKVGKTRIYRSPLGQIVHLGYSSTDEAAKLWFGYDHYEKNIRYADAEKAFLDTLYFYQSGHKFSFNIYSDIQVEKLDRKIIKQYLSHYQNPKFVKFAEGVLYGRHQIG